MTDAARPAVIAIGAGIAIAVLLFVPFVALQYRRRGTVTFGASLVDFAMLVYALALVAYTLLPLPVVTADFCAGGGVRPQLQPGRFVADIIDNGIGSPSEVLRNPALLQVLLNVGLFAPLGVFLRQVFRRGIPTTVLIGVGVSALIESTQLTGDWFAFPCPYRLFDVDDLLANVVGALIGAVVARVLPGRRATDAGTPRPVSAARRLLGMLCDVASLTFVGGTVTAIYGTVVLVTHASVPAPIDSLVRVVGTFIVPAAIELGLVLRLGRTLGELAVRLEPARRTGPWRAFIRWLVGIGGYSLLLASDLAILAGPFVIAMIVSVYATRGRRGLSYLAAGWDVVDDRVDGSVPPLHTP